MTIFTLPDLGEGLPDAEISEWHVRVGEHVVLDQSLVSMETAKAVVEVPSPFTGIIKKLYGNVGDIIKTGAPLVELESDASTVSREADLLKPRSETNGSDAGTVAGRLEVGTTILTESATGVSVGIRTASGGIVKITPALRREAQRLGIDLASITPTGPNNTIIRQDILGASTHANASTSPYLNANATTISSTAPSAALGTPAAGYEPLKGVRRTMAYAMIQAHKEVVPVTIMEDAVLSRWQEPDAPGAQAVTPSSHRLAPSNAKKPDITVKLIQAVIEAIKMEPALNVVFDGKTLSRKFMQEVHVGMAVDTADGLFVPVIHHAESMDSTTLRDTVDRLKKQVADRSIKPEDLRGATITLSNFGKFAGRYANPIVVPPMVAILGVGRLRFEAVALQGEIRICPVLPLALTFDHRAVTGGEATRFLGAVVKAIER